ncbi:MAG: SAM-dependent DNA methyltransferase [Candidatus Dadabacteria bacterium]|nr:SAM-dependent DNA methyltransferase [Candidatus Dadabacteria bacterium]MYA48784.1 SAM-dependent DNA methyltransferase [Candidatus Dadabacteria bacterium]MYG82760.1 SAM-dependent DNA methyltransferase [Candidatus Dadabacteria bacterium]MYK49340.1 SAM-dependent DNA methyltransferase [Candidatus Dadabacteria bacterium]
MTIAPHQILPRSGPEREELRKKGQFWTPEWVADAMVSYVLQDDCDEIFDPAVGTGAFFHAAKRVSEKLNVRVHLSGSEIDLAALESGKKNGLSGSDLFGVEHRDFIRNPPRRSYSGIVANPPYIRHHYVSRETKDLLQKAFWKISGIKLDGRAGLHVYFLIKSLRLLKPNGRLCFIVPADVCEGVFADTLWGWIGKNYALDAVTTFAPEATPFPGVDTNPIILMLRNAPPQDKFKWCICNEWGTRSLYSWIRNGLKKRSYKGLKIRERTLIEGLSTGFSRPPTKKQKGIPLYKFACTMRGIATGENRFFFLTSAEIKKENIPLEYFVRAIGRTRDVGEDTLTLDHLDRLDEIQRPTYLLSLSDESVGALPTSVRSYLEKGVNLGISSKSLIAKRHPWYRMEKRVVPPILFSYLGRKNARFIRNLAGAVPLTGFLCVYPRINTPDFVDKLFLALSDARTISNLHLVGKSYGGGSIKVEPRSLEKLQIPLSVIKDSRLHLP